MCVLSVQIACSGTINAFQAGDEYQEKPLVLPPLASAGADRQIPMGLPSFLYGGGSYHPNRNDVTYYWQQLEGEVIYLSNNTAASPTFIAPLEAQTLRFQLTVSDRFWQTTDDVMVEVISDIEHLEIAPYFAAGNDRVLNFGEAEKPSNNDIIESRPEEAQVLWEKVTVQSQQSSYPFALPDVHIYRGQAHGDRLASAPDYLLLYPYSSHLQGQVAPTVALRGVDDAILIGEHLLLNADAQDLNQDSMMLRWEQTQGVPVENSEREDMALNIITPLYETIITFRVFASDGKLESTPATVRIVTSYPEGTGSNSSSNDSLTRVNSPLVLSPKINYQTHTGNKIWLYASPAIAFEMDSLDTILWKQTHGRQVAIEVLDDTRWASLKVPQEKGVLAFMVQSERAMGDGLIARIPPKLMMIDILESSNNQEPSIHLCAAWQSVDTGTYTKIIATVNDPEQDVILTTTWSGAALEQEVTAPDPSTISLPARCNTREDLSSPPSSMLDAATDTVITIWLFTPPGMGSTGIPSTPGTGNPSVGAPPLDISMTACDILGACGSTQLAAQ